MPLSINFLKKPWVIAGFSGINVDQPLALFYRLTVPEPFSGVAYALQSTSMETATYGFLRKLMERGIEHHLQPITSFDVYIVAFHLNPTPLDEQDSDYKNRFNAALDDFIRDFGATAV